MSGHIYQIGKHRVRHGDVYDQKGIRDLIGGNRVHIFYSDPPWGAGNLKYWDTMNQKQNAEPPRDPPGGFDVDLFLDKVLYNARTHTRGFVVIEYGKRWIDKVIQAAQIRGLYFCGQIETLYKSSSKYLPLEILVFHTDQVAEIDLSRAIHTAGYNTVHTIFSCLAPPRGKTGADLCCGGGFTAQACIDHGMRFLGNELNWKRLQSTIKRLEKDQGVEAVCLTR